MLKDKICSMCGKKLSIKKFHKDKSQKSGYYTKCKECKKKYTDERKKYKKEYDKKYNKENKDKIKYKHHEYYLKNKILILENGKKWYEKNKERTRLYVKKYREKNKDKLIRSSHIYAKIYREKNKKELNNKRSEKIKNNPNFKLRIYFRNRMRNALKGICKSDKTLKVLGIDNIENLWTHLESKFYNNKTTNEPMTKENYGKWHVDHIIPCASFDLTDPLQQMVCFHYTNLQPLWAEDNLKKGTKTYL